MCDGSRTEKDDSRFSKELVDATNVELIEMFYANGAIRCHSLIRLAIVDLQEKKAVTASLSWLLRTKKVYHGSGLTRKETS